MLPLFAETAEHEPARKPFTTVIQAAQAVGLRFHVTSGVIEEVETHIFNSRRYAAGSFGTWRGRIPFLFTSYITSGLPRPEFAAWAEEFRSDARPLEDVEEYLEEVFGISRRDLTGLASKADQALRNAVQELWASAHEKRRMSRGTDIDSSTMLRLVAHDVENCVGVIVARKESPESSFGYRHWWLTLDRVAYGLESALHQAMGRSAPPSPAMDVSYLVRILRMTRTRTKISAELRLNLPLLLDFPLRTHKPEELIRIAEEIRRDNISKSERVIRHAIRDRMDKLRTLKSPGAGDGAERYSKNLGLFAEELEA